MFNQCCVVGCGSFRGEENLFRLPKSETSLKKWLLFINCDSLRNLSYSQLRNKYVCRKHFEKRCFSQSSKRSRLLVTAYPTLFTKSEIANGIPEIDSAIICPEHAVHKDHVYIKRRHEDHSYCKDDIVNYPWTETGEILHSFPNPKKFPEMYKLWVKLVGGELTELDDFIYYRKHRICDAHFTPNDRNRNNRLNCLAVPTLFLPKGKSEVKPSNVQKPNESASSQISVPENDFEENTDFQTDGDRSVQLNDYEDLTLYDDDVTENEPEKQFDDEIHEGFCCNICEGPIRKYRYTCIQCNDFDMCSGCEMKGMHSLHYVLRIPAPKPFGEIQEVLTQIKNYVMNNINTEITIKELETRSRSNSPENQEPAPESHQNDDPLHIVNETNIQMEFEYLENQVHEEEKSGNKEHEEENSDNEEVEEEESDNEELEEEESDNEKHDEEKSDNDEHEKEKYDIEEHDCEYSDNDEQESVYNDSLEKRDTLTDRSTVEERSCADVSTIENQNPEDPLSFKELVIDNQCLNKSVNQTNQIVVGTSKAYVNSDLKRKQQASSNSGIPSKRAHIAVQPQRKTMPVTKVRSSNQAILLPNQQTKVPHKVTVLKNVLLPPQMLSKSVNINQNPTLDNTLKCLQNYKNK